MGVIDGVIDGVIEDVVVNDDTKILTGSYLSGYSFSGGAVANSDRGKQPVYAVTLAGFSVSGLLCVSSSPSLHRQ